MIKLRLNRSIYFTLPTAPPTFFGNIFQETKRLQKQKNSFCANAVVQVLQLHIEPS